MRIKPWAKKEKVLIGVSHDSDDISPVVSELKGIKVSRIAVEVPEGFDGKGGERHLLFFTPLVKHFHNAGAAIIPIDDATSRPPVHLQLAMAVVRGELRETQLFATVSHLEMDLRSNGCYWPPEEYHNVSEMLHDHAMALEVLKGGDPRLVWNRMNRFREAHMLRVIRDTEPDAVVIGSSHAEVLRSVLRDYRHVDLSVPTRLIR
ncbi:MAG: hypothetical protein KGH72_03785 [Candidatus Micrarchaeota archaeon]|nr:hypothetical protein [Candidatus Micrarchaeota archaeon]